MDYSKLPKLSETAKQAQQEHQVAHQQPGAGEYPPDAYAPVRAPMMAQRGPEVWFNVAIGVILLLMQPRMIQWVSSRIFGTHFNEFVLNDGTVVPYPQVAAFWMDLGPTLFAFVLIADALVFGRVRWRAAWWGVFALTAVTTGYNLIYVVMSYSSYGLALLSALAALFGAYIVMNQWRILQATARLGA